MPRECTGHSKHSLPTTQDSTHGHHQMVNSKIWLYSLHPWHTPLPIWKQSVFPNPVQTLDFWFAYRFHRRVRWSGIPISLRIFQFVVIHTVKGFSIVNEAEVHVFLEFSWFFYVQRMLATWSLFPLPFLNPAWTSVISWFRYYWSLAWSILSIT